MKKNIFFTILILATQPAALSTRASAQENETPNGRITGAAIPEKTDLMSKRIGKVQMMGTELTQFLNFLKQETGASFIVDENVPNVTFTVYLRNVTLRELFELLAKTKGLKVQRAGPAGTFRVSKDATPLEAFPPLTRKDIEDPLFNRLVTVDVKSAKLVTFLDMISAAAKVNFILTEEQDITITIKLTRTTIADVLLFLRTRGLTYSRIGENNTFVIRMPMSSDKLVNAENAFKDAKYEKAVRLYEELAKKFPDSEIADYALLRAAISYDWIAARDNAPSALKEEVKLLNRLIYDYPKSSRLGDAYLYLGQIYSGYGGAKAGAIDCKKAIKFYDLAIKNTYRDWVKAQAQGRIAQCYERDGQKEKAEAAYREIVEKYPGTETAEDVRAILKEPDTLLATGLNLEKQKEYQLAITVYKRIVEKDPTAPTAREAEERIHACQAAMDTKR